MAAKPASGIAMVLVGLWLVAQGIGGDLGGRVRVAAAPKLGKGTLDITDPDVIELMKQSKKRVP